MHDLTPLQLGAMQIIQLRSKDNPITGANLANRIGLKPRKDGKAGADMRSIIHALRVKGYPICADGDGYWWPATSTELSTYITSFEGRVLDQEKALAGLKLGFDKVQPQAPEPITVLGSNKLWQPNQ